MKKNSFISILCISLLGAIITAFAYVLSIYLHLPPSDGAYQSGFHNVMFDPFVITIALTFAVLIGIIFSPLLYFFLRYKNLKIAYPAIQFIVIGTIFIVPDNQQYTIIGACIAMIISAIVLWLSPIGKLKPLELQSDNNRMHRSTKGGQHQQ